MRSGRPPGPGKAIKSVEGFAPHRFKGFPGPSRPARPQKCNPKNPARLPSGTQKVDVWSAGAVLFVCIRGGMPYKAQTDLEALSCAQGGRILFDEAWNRLDFNARLCVESLMVLDADARLLAAAALELPWLR